MLNIDAELKSKIALSGTSLKKVMSSMNASNIITTSYSNIAHKLRTGTITFYEVQKLLDFLGYKITIDRK